MNGDRFYFDTRTPWSKHQYNPNNYTQWLGVKTFKIWNVE